MVVQILGFLWFTVQTVYKLPEFFLHHFLKLRRTFFTLLLLIFTSLLLCLQFWKIKNEPAHEKNNRKTCIQPRLRSAWASAQSDQRLPCPLKNPWVLGYPYSLSEDWSDCGDMQPHLSLCWVHMSFCWFCCAPAEFKLKNKTNNLKTCI